LGLNAKRWISNISKTEIRLLKEKTENNVVEGERRRRFMLRRRELIPSLLIILMGTLDCLTTMIGVTYEGAKELNPAMAVIVDSNVGAFLIVKIVATVFIAVTYILARQILQRMPNTNGKTFHYSIKALTFAYAGVAAFIALAVVNNLIILIK
jgi:hypothetical protein